MEDLTHEERNAARIFDLRDTYKPLINIFLPGIMLKKGLIISITGDSGTGKTLFLETIEKSTTKSVCNLNNIVYEPERSAFLNIYKYTQSTEKTLKILSKSGLAEAGLMLRPVKTYSTGEIFRFKLALAIARKFEVVIIDEFGMPLDEILAKNIAFSLRIIADKEEISFFVASCSNSYLKDLQPNVSFELDETNTRVCTNLNRRRKVSYHRRLTVKRADNKTWKLFAHWHYKSHQTGPTSDIFTLNLDGKPIGVIVYGYPSIFSAFRNEATDNRYAVNQPDFMKKLNSEVRIIRRVVMLPKFRGVGLGCV